MIKIITKKLGLLCILLAVTSNTLKADMMFYYSAAILPSIVANKTPVEPIKPMVSFKDNEHGYEPWVVDIENNEAHMVKDIHRGGHGAVIKSMFITISGSTYFFADDGVNGYGLWKTDGSEKGTVLVKNYHNTMTPYQLFEFNGKAYFLVYAKGFGNQIWSSDGTTEGTVCITLDANLGVVSTLVVGDTIYFSAAKKDGRGQYFYNQLWKTDGTIDGIRKLTDMEGYGADNLVDVNGTLYFRFFKYDGTKHLYRTDGTVEGLEAFPKTLLGKDIPLVPFKNKLLLFNSQQKSLKVFNGEEFILVKNFGESDTSIYNLTDITTTDNAVYFVAKDSVYGKELFRTDGTIAGTVLIEGLPLKDAQYGGNKPDDLAYMNHTLYFTYHNIGDIWSVEDGSSTAHMIIEVSGYNPIRYMKRINNLLYIWKNDSWLVSNGTQEGTLELKIFKNNLLYNETSSSYPYIAKLAGLSQCGSKVCTYSDDGIHGFELWSTDGTASGTRLLKDINVVNKNSVFEKFDFINNRRVESNLGARYTPSKEYAKMNNKYIFIGRDENANSDVYDKEFFISDGTEEGTSKLTENGQRISAEVRSYGLFTKKDDFLYFIGSDENNNHSLYRTDATSEGTKLIKEIGTSSSGWISSLINHNEMLYFNSSSKLWKSDGTREGTVIIKDLNGVSTHPDIQYIFPSENEKMYIMTASDSLWISDGNSSNTFEIFTDDTINVSQMFTLDTQIYLETFGVSVKLYKVNDTNLTLLEVDEDIGRGGIVINNTIYFVKNRSRELWKFSDSGEEISLVKDNFSSGSLAQLVNVNNTLFFVAGDETQGEELWKSDGTTVGTVIVKDITVGPLSSEIKILNVEGSKILFTVKNTEGLQLWVSDGTEAGTKVLDTVSN